MLKVKAGELAGAFRCKKRREIGTVIKKVPKGADTNQAQMTALTITAADGNVDAIESIVPVPISYRDFLSVRYLLYNMIVRQNLSYDFKTLISALYEIADFPTEATKEMRKKEDILLFSRFFYSRKMTPEPYEKLDDTVMAGCVAVSDDHDLVFKGTREFKRTVKTGKKNVAYSETLPFVEVVRFFPSSPSVTQTGKGVDTGAARRLELYSMLKASFEKYGKEMPENTVFLASYYYLSKNSDSDYFKGKGKFDGDFFSGKGGNIVSISATAADVMKLIDSAAPMFLSYSSGEDVDDKVCDGCSFKSVCKGKAAPLPLPESERKRKSLPELSDEQRAAVSALSGNVRCEATAGSGKTSVMAYRITKLLERGVSPEDIGCFTFTNLAAREMQDRIADYCMDSGITADISRMTISTLHAFGYSVISDNYKALGYTQKPVLVNGIQKVNIITKVLRESEEIKELAPLYRNFYLDMYNAKGILPFATEVFTLIKECGIKDTDALREAIGTFSEETLRRLLELFGNYEKYLKDQNLIEYSDQERLILQLDSIIPGVLAKYHLKHICVDEYQDTSSQQFEIYALLRKCPCTESFFVVGDGNQSIYGFRGASPKYIHNFDEMFAFSGPCTDVPLTRNYRSSRNIVDFAADIVKRNGDTSMSPKAGDFTGKPVRVEDFESKEDEQAFIVDTVRSYISNGTAPEDIAILTATNAELEPIADELDRLNIQYINLNPAPVLEDVKVLSVISAAEILKGGARPGAAYIAASGSGDISPSLPADEAASAISSKNDKILALGTAESFMAYLESLNDDEGTDEVYDYFLTDIKNACEKEIEKGDLDGILSYIIDYKTFGTKETAKRVRRYPGVVLTTAHSSKGKEWKVVIVSVSKFHTKDMTEEDVEEKRRLLFVACTRAEKELIVSGVANAFGSKSGGYTENMYLKEAEEALKTQV